MFDWLSSLFASMAYNAAIYSAGLASTNGMCQLKEPASLQKAARKEQERANDEK